MLVLTRLASHPNPIVSLNFGSLNVSFLVVLSSSRYFSRTGLEIVFAVSLSVAALCACTFTVSVVAQIAVDDKGKLTKIKITEGGDKRNDENILIIKDKAIAEKFLKEFSIVYG